jgi:hypothetical protein
MAFVQFRAHSGLKTLRDFALVLENQLPKSRVLITFFESQLVREKKRCNAM